MHNYVEIARILTLSMIKKRAHLTNSEGICKSIYLTIMSYLEQSVQTFEKFHENVHFALFACTYIF